MCGFEGGESIVSTSMLTESQAVNLLSVDFLCQLCQQTDKSLHTDCIVTDLVKLSDCDDKDAWSSNKAFDVHLVSMTECVLQLHLSLIATFLRRNFVRCFNNIIFLHRSWFGNRMASSCSKHSICGTSLGTLPKQGMMHRMLHTSTPYKMDSSSL